MAAPRSLRNLVLAARPAPMGTAATGPTRRLFSSTPRRFDDQSRAKAAGLKQTMQRPEITPLFLFTGAIASLALFFGFRHLFTDPELNLDHHARQRLSTKAENLDFDAMAKVADDPDGKLTKEGMEMERERSQRRQDIKDEKAEKEGRKKPE
ncbi:uncharacterized protein PFL1_03140 [Pseudozyma flocculosa PF-1]|uniref:Uncharacterized protein n=2 Tax=Pseudozyma flocculosa TaxID=84751 RepID=A0A5C3F202_9BASI|nr:uncharacterized protein PFL1_03140 [Pseudozyma flocculosa PF-1]EPQ29385.1 hypothetical protein PFL1_03140 [Pseudozyma flocculosa PF-1]SPO37906.1 uncharacterized protein PSFLO_03383 [Pseudozyma flocculosa]